MSGSTSRSGLYLFGGGSDGLYPPDELMDSTKINNVIKAIDLGLPFTVPTATGLSSIPGGAKGQRVTAVDTGVEYWWTGTAWKLWIGSTYVGSPSNPIVMGANVSDVAGRTNATRSGINGTLVIAAQNTGTITRGATLCTVPSDYFPATQAEGPLSLYNNSATLLGIVHAYFRTDGVLIFDANVVNGTMNTSQGGPSNMFGSFSYRAA